MENYKYDAFISYRHTDLDKFVAENLHKYMETYKLPRNILRTANLKKNHIERVFRDKEELPITNNLEDPIIEALRQSEYLIVICSPRLRESIWCKKEIESFIELHGRHKVLAVLIEGEPEDSFPPELLYATEEITQPDGSVQTITKNVEPLAADVRGATKKEVRCKIKTELLRLLAPIFGVGYDELRQRHRERRMKKIITGSVAIASLCALIGIGSTVAALMIQNQKQQLSEHQAVSLANDATDLLANGDRVGAIDTALSALTSYDGIELPYTAEAELALSESLSVYDFGRNYVPQYQYTTVGLVQSFFVSPENNYLVAADNTGSLYVWDVKTNKLLTTLPGIDKDDFKDASLCFIDNDTFAYIAEDNSIQIYRISSGKTVQKLTTGTSPTGVCADSTGKWLAINSLSAVTVFATESYEKRYERNATNQYNIDSRSYFASGSRMIFTENAAIRSSNSKKLAGSLVHIIDLNSAKENKKISLKYDAVKNITFDGNTAYIVANRFSDNDNLVGAIQAININNGKTLWTTTRDNNFFNKLKVADFKTGKELCVNSAMELLILNPKTGKIKESVSAESSILNFGIFKDSGMYSLFTADGTFAFITNEREHIIYDNYFMFHSNHIRVLDSCAAGYLILPYSDNRITSYAPSVNPDKKAYAGDTSFVKEDNEKIDITKDPNVKQLEKAALVSHVLYSDDKATMYVSYSDSSIEIYRTSDMTLLETISDAACDATDYLGTDKDGNTYIAGDTAGYRLNTDNELIAIIDNLRHVDKEKNLLVVSTLDKEEFFQLPIYSKEQLVAKAKKSAVD